MDELLTIGIIFVIIIIGNAITDKLREISIEVNYLKSTVDKLEQISIWTYKMVEKNEEEDEQ